MKKYITIAFLILSALLILDSMNISHAIMMFLLAGVIPGTNIAIGASQMLEFFMLVAGFTIGRVMMYMVKNFKVRTIETSQAQA